MTYKDIEQKRAKAREYMRLLRADPVRYKQHKEDVARSQVLRYYGLNDDEYRSMLKSNPVCQICGKPETQRSRNGNVKPLSIDHDKETGKVRGVLCGRCNTGIGQLQHDPELLLRAIEYLNGAR